MADLAKLVVRLEAQSAQLLTELEKANRKIDRFAAQTTKTLQKWSGGLLAAFSARALIQFGAGVLKAQDNLKDMAEKAGVSVENLSRLGYAASQSGTDIEGLETGLAKLSKTAVAASEGSKESAAAFKALGVEAENADGSLKATDQLLLEIADSFSKHADGAAKSALAQKIFDKSGADLIPFLNQGAAGIEELTKKADELGITVSGKAAKAADEFNDSMATLAAVTRGVVGQALGELTPIMNKFSEGMLTGAQSSGAFDKAARVLAAGLKILLSAGVIIGEVFDRVGSAIGNTAASLAAIVQGDFRRALNIQVDFYRESAESVGKTADELVTIWSAAGEKIAKEAAATDEALKGSFSFGGNSDALQEVKIGLEKIDVSPMEKFYADLDGLTATAQEKSLRSIAEQRAALEELVASRRISDEQYIARLDEIKAAENDALGITKLQVEAEERRTQLFADGAAIFEATRTPLELYEQSLIRLNLLLQQGAIDQETYTRAVVDAQDKLDEAGGKMTDFAEQMRRNTQDILGQGLVDVMKGSSSDILEVFTDMVTKLVAQALAAQLAEKLFGTGTGGSSSGGWVDAAIGIFSSFAGGSRDGGGRGQPGMAYAIGTGAQPEVYVPDQPGTFYPRGEMGGAGGNITQNINVSGRPDQRTARQIQIEAARQQRVATARLG